VLAIFAVGIVLHEQGRPPSRIVMSRHPAFRPPMLIQKARTGGRLHQQRVPGSARGCRNSSRAGPVPAVRDRPGAMDPGRLRPLVEFTTCVSYDGKRPAVEIFPSRCPAQPSHWSPDGAGKSTAIALLHRAFRSAAGIIKIDAWMSAA